MAEVPNDLIGPGAISAETHRWLGRAYALLTENTDKADPLHLYDLVTFKTASDGLGGIEILREQRAHEIVTILHRALAAAERKAPAAAQGAFIPVGAAFNVLQVIGKVLIETKNDVLVVDAYMDSKVLTDFAPLVQERVAVRLLTDSHYTKLEALKPAAERWVKQFGDTRPIAIRFTPPRKLHDRLIMIDGDQVWSLTQSLKDMAARSPASVLRVEGEIARQRIHAYGQTWADAHPLQ